MIARVTGRRARFVRFVAALAVLAGLSLVVGLQCTEGMSMSVTVHCDASAGHEAVDMCGAETTHDGVGDVLMTCLAFIVAVIAVAVWLRPVALHGAVRMARSARAVVLRAVERRAPSLEELCLLRT
jgi:hypothetical protein